MSRARATALALVNWKGVFFERYLLDPHVTALEGANGAGKTTVMVAAYVVLLPDLNRLRFTNIGESGTKSGDRGIWGRLGELGRPSYVAMEVALASEERVVLGVLLERKSEPSLELTPFLIRGVAPEGTLKSLFVLSRDDEEEIPDFDGVRDRVGAVGGTIQVFASAKEYFASLFELGITPFRLGADEERNKWNEMLRTSMTGGISRALTTDLRSFLLKEETGLSETLSRMRANLDTCHRTRVEVSEAKRLEHEISGVYEAGQSMFAAAMLAVERAAVELEAEEHLARSAEEAARAEAGVHQQLLAESEARVRAVEERVAMARASRNDASRAVERFDRASRLAELVSSLETELDAANRRANEHQTVVERTLLEKTRRREERDRAREAYERASRGLGDLQRGLEELHLRVHARRRAERGLEDLRAMLDRPTLVPGDVAATEDELRTRCTSLDRERAHLDREAELARVRGEEWRRARAALRALEGEENDVGSPYERARIWLARLDDLERLEAQVATLSEECRSVEELARRQKKLRARVDALGVSSAGSPGDRLEVELREAEGLRSTLENRIRDEAIRADILGRRIEATRAEHERLQKRAQTYAEIAPLAKRTEEAIGFPLASRADLVRAQSLWAVRGDELRRAIVSLEERREECLRNARALEQTGGVFHPELLRIREELDAELLAARFEDVEPDEAARLEASLGSLSHALVVDDLERAEATLVGRGRELETVWLVKSGDMGPLPSGRARIRGDDLLVEEEFGLRITRLPETPSLGRSARERRARELRDEADRIAALLEEAVLERRAFESVEEALEKLSSNASALEEADPEAARTDAARALAESEAELEASTARASEARRELTALGARIDALRPCLREAYLLDPPEYVERLAELTERLRVARAAQTELARTKESRRTLRELVDVLRTTVCSDEDLAALDNRRRAVDAERDRAFAALARIEELRADLSGLLAPDLAPELAERISVVPALEAQHEGAKEALRRAEAALEEAERTWEGASDAWRAADAERRAAELKLAHMREARLAEGMDDLGEEARVRLERDLRDIEESLHTLDREMVEQTSERALAIERARLAEERTRSLHDARIRAEEAAQPATARWETLRDEAGSLGLLGAVEIHGRIQGWSERTVIELASEARSRAALLLDRVRASRGGEESANAIEEWIEASETFDGALSLRIWREVREWLSRRLPSHVADIADPLEALERLRANLSILEERLARQERDLRGASEDVARGIDVQIRRAQAQVRRLNQSLEGIQFGSIAAIRVQMRRNDRMAQILEALREGAAQELLFQTSMPIEEALDEIFRRFGGGRGGGQRILDYREYLELSVEVRRRSKGEWELASPTRLSTGEAIGVGAALMMVVLTEWERDAHLLRSKRSSGSLRFLFLDEANRLSQDNLAVLFDLCQNLDLQLLIAAPEVARSVGNTTYRLVRNVLDDGREEVLVSGRRTVDLSQVTD